MNGAGTTLEGRENANRRASQAAARVAARFAHAPSYGDVLMDEARAAMRAAEAATQAAMEAHAAVQSMLAGLENAAPQEEEWGPVAVPDPAPKGEASTKMAPFASETDETPIQVEEPVREAFRDEEWREPEPDRINMGGEAAEPLTAAEPIYANLIQFPREMVAPRKMRPRRVEGPLAGTAEQTQLSIFEVEPEMISTEPAVAMETPAAPVWMRAELTSFKAAEPEPETLLEEPALRPPPIRLAGVDRRILSFMVDGSLVVVFFLSAVLPLALKAHLHQTPRGAGITALVFLVLIGLAYQALFLTLAGVTPGMAYAGIRLRTFEGRRPSRTQLYERLMALPLSVLPMGLGVVWSVFDESGLSWHDRLSRTYLRMR